MFKVELNPTIISSMTKVAEWLEAGAKHVTTDNGRKIDGLDMNYGVFNTDSCGTTCCIAGAVVQFEGLGKLNRLQNINYWGDLGAERLVCDHFGLGVDQRGEMKPLFEPWLFWFYTDRAEQEDDCWCEYDVEPFNNPETAAKVVRHFIETGVIDWKVGSPEMKLHKPKID